MNKKEADELARLRDAVVSAAMEESACDGDDEYELCLNAGVHAESEERRKACRALANFTIRRAARQSGF